MIFILYETALKSKKNLLSLLFYARLVENIFKWRRSMESIFLKLAQYPIVETERLLLRPVTLDDAEAMFDYASDKDNTRYTFLTNQKLEETKK